jgi:hypothetical protein
MKDNDIKEIIFDALQNSYADAVIVHKIDSENSAIEMDYHMIAYSIINSLDENGYQIIKLSEA